jgi:hypothetical protein
MWSVRIRQPAPQYYLRKVLSGGMLRLGRSGEGSNPSMETSHVVILDSINILHNRSNNYGIN